MDYNLLSEKWIPVLYRNGTFDRVGIRQALQDAGQIRQIAATNPMDRVAILRFLLALLYWCRGNPPMPSPPEASPRDSFPSDWFAKLDANSKCFNLLGDGKRFYQNDAYKLRTPEHTTNYLIQEVPSGTNKWHFRHATDGVNGLCPACCAMGLIRLPLFATSGGKGMTSDTGKSPGVNAKPPIYAFALGETLGDTLRLSWRRFDGEMGVPAWENAATDLPLHGEVPLLTGMTWLPRSVWLADPEKTAPCISCGDRGSVVRLCVFDGRGSARAEDRVWRDPHVLFGEDKKGNSFPMHAGDALGSSDAGATQWTKILAGLLKRQDPADRMAHVWVVGFSTVQNDKYLEATESLLPFSCSPQKAQETLARIERWQNEVFSLSRKVRPASEKGSSRKHDEISALLATIRPEAESSAAGRTEDLLAGGDEEWQVAADGFEPMMNVIAGSLSPGFTTKAVQRRRQIASILPNMHPKTELAKKPSRKKGGDK